MEFRLLLQTSNNALLPPLPPPIATPNIGSQTPLPKIQHRYDYSLDFSCISQSPLDLLPVVVLTCSSRHVSTCGPDDEISFLLMQWLTGPSPQDSTTFVCTRPLFSLQLALTARSLIP